MNSMLYPWQVLLVTLAGWINQQQQEIVEYLKTENLVLREKIGTRRILLNDDQRRRLAVKAKVLGRKVLEEIATLVTPDTSVKALRSCRTTVCWRPTRPPTEPAFDSSRFRWA